MKATEAMIGQRDPCNKEHLLNRRIEDFLRDFAPKDPEDRCRFEMRFIEIVRATHELAAEPFYKALTDAYAAVPPLHFYKPPQT